MGDQMLTHQKTAQLDMLEAEKKRAIEQAYKQQHSQLEMAKTQRDMAIQQQAAHMAAQASQYQLHVEMQASMAKAYGTAFNPGAASKGSTKPTTDTGKTTPKKGGKTPPKK